MYVGIFSTFQTVRIQVHKHTPVNANVLHYLRSPGLTYIDVYVYRFTYQNIHTYSYRHIHIHVCTRTYIHIRVYILDTRTR
jgi:hypothetical protein